jgi:hypothetical protein
MQPPKTLRFYARGEAMVQDYDALLEQGIQRYVGRRNDPTLGIAFKDKATGQEMRMPAWVPMEEADEVPYRAEYVRECKAGCLWPADEETAKACGVDFDASRGGEAGEQPGEDQ